jgi:hypothetical protein
MRYRRRWIFQPTTAWRTGNDFQTPTAPPALKCESRAKCYQSDIVFSPKMRPLQPLGH